MSIKVQCLQCGATHRVNDRLAGRRVRCPECETAVHVPERNSGNGGDGEFAQSPRGGLDPEPMADEVKTAATLAAEPVEAIPVAATVAQLAAAPVVSQIPLEDDDEEVPRRKAREADELDMTPMVDVTFLLLIFFMVTAAFSLQKSIQMPRQQTDQPSSSPVEEETEDLDMVEVQVDDMGSFLVMAPEWERETPGKQNLISALKDAIAGNNDGMRLVVKVHELAKLQYLVDAMDAGTIAGYAELEVMQVEGFD